MTQIERNEKYRENNGITRKTIDIRTEDYKWKVLSGVSHSKIYEAGVKYLVELEAKSQHSENLS